MSDISSLEFLVFYLTVCLPICLFSEINRSHSFQSLLVIVSASTFTPSDPPAYSFSFSLSDLHLSLQDFLELGEGHGQYARGEFSAGWVAECLDSCVGCSCTLVCTKTTVLVELSVLFLRLLVLSSAPQTLFTVTSSSLASLAFMLSHSISFGRYLATQEGCIIQELTLSPLPKPFFSYYFKKKVLTLIWKSLFNSSFFYLSGFMPSLSCLWLLFHVLVDLTCITHAVRAVSTVRAFPCQSTFPIITYL